MYIYMPDPKLSAAENLLSLMRPDRKYTVLEAKVLDTASILHMEHGGANLKFISMMGNIREKGNFDADFALHENIEAVAPTIIQKHKNLALPPAPNVDFCDCQNRRLALARTCYACLARAFSRKKFSPANDTIARSNFSCGELMKGKVCELAKDKRIHKKLYRICNLRDTKFFICQN